MPSTPLKGYTVPTTGSEVGTWGDDLNANLQGILDQNMAGLVTLALSSSNVTLNATQAQANMIRCIGVLLSNVIITSANNGFYCFENLTNGAFAVTLLGPVGTGVAIPQSRRCVIYADTTNGARIVAIAQSNINAPEIIGAGNQMFFATTSPPTSWTKVSIYNDFALRLISGTVTAGGSVNFSTLFGRTATDSYTLVAGNIPTGPGLSYDKLTTTVVNTYSGTGPGVTVGATPFTATALTGAAGQGFTMGIDMRVKYLDIILATKD